MQYYTKGTVDSSMRNALSIVENNGKFDEKLENVAISKNGVALVSELYDEEKALLEKITKGQGTLEDLDLLEELSATITETALCGLGQSACKPVISTLKYFRNEYLAHVVDKHCPHCNGKKKVLAIDPEKCKGCTKCAKQCPMEAISGEVRKPHVIDADKFIKCNACVSACPFGAIG